jgi:hypothetical protein
MQEAAGSGQSPVVPFPSAMQQAKLGLKVKKDQEDGEEPSGRITVLSSILSLCTVSGHCFA